MKKIVIYFLFLSLFAAGCNKTKEAKKQENTNSGPNIIKVVDSPFETTTTNQASIKKPLAPPGKMLLYDYNKAYLIDLTNFDILASTTIPEIFNSNFGFEFNGTTGDMLYFTLGASEYDGTCMNKDGSCTNRFYSTNIYTNKTTLLWGTEEWPTQSYVVDKNNIYFITQKNIKNDSILDLTKPDNYTKIALDLSKIDVTSGKMSQISHKEFENVFSFGNFTITNDGSKLYMTSSGKKPQSDALEELSVNYIDLSDLSFHSLVTLSVQNPQDFFDEAFYSPQQNYIAYFVRNKPFVLNIQSAKSTPMPDITMADMSNANLVWSSDEKRIYINTRSGLKYYDVETQTINPINNISSQQTFLKNATDKFLFLSVQRPESFEGKQIYRWRFEVYDIVKEKFVKLPRILETLDFPGIRLAN